MGNACWWPFSNDNCQVSAQEAYNQFAQAQSSIGRPGRSVANEGTSLLQEDVFIIAVVPLILLLIRHIIQSIR